jgi:hypothetical protein
MNTTDFSKYRRHELPPLRKLAVGEQFTARMTGVHEWSPGPDEPPVPVLELVGEDGEEFGWRATAWRAIDALDRANPQVNSWITVIRKADIGRSHDYSIHVGAKGAGTDELGF